MRERLIFLSSFPEDPTVDVHQSKRQSQAHQRELRVGIETGSFDKLQEVGDLTDPLPSDRKSADNSTVTSQPSSLD